MSIALDVSGLQSLDSILKNEKLYYELLYFLEQFRNIKSYFFKEFMKILSIEVTGSLIFYEKYIHLHKDEQIKINNKLSQNIDLNSIKPYHFTNQLIQNAKYNYTLHEILHNLVYIFFNSYINYHLKYNII